MVYFSGFCFQNEQKLFKDFLLESEFSVAGFSYGTIKAFEFTLKSKKRIDRLQLFSPAFFQDKEEKFKKLQLRAFKKNRDIYLDTFYKNVLYPSEFDISKYKKEDSLEDLEKLLHYKWKKEKLDIITKRGIKLEVYLGEVDKIIDTKKAKEFFASYATVYWLNNCGHILKGV